MTERQRWTVTAAFIALLILLTTVASLLTRGRSPVATMKQPATKPAAAVAAAAATQQAKPRATKSEDGMFHLAGIAGLPTYLKGDGGTLADPIGICGGELRSRRSDLIDHDFVFDLLYTFREPGEGEAYFWAGLGANQKDGGWLLDSVWARLDRPWSGSQAVARLVNQHETSDFGQYGNDRGPHLLRITKVKRKLTFAISAAYTGKFKPVASKTIDDLGSAAPFLKSHNSALFFGGSAAWFQAVSLSIDGATVDPDEGAQDSQAPTKISGSGEKLSFFSLAGSSGLPPGFRSDGLSLADQRGLTGNLLTIESNYVEHDFTFDVAFRFNGSPEREEAFFGIGEGRWAGNGGEAVCLNLHGPQFGDYSCLAEIGAPGMAGQRLAQLPKGDAGPWMLRLRKVRRTLTFAIGAAPGQDGIFQPQFSKTFPDLPSVAPFLNRRTSRLFMLSTSPMAAVRFMVDGKVMVDQSAQ